MKKNFWSSIVIVLFAAVGMAGCLPFLEGDEGYGSCSYQMSAEGLTLSNCANFIGDSYMMTAQSICGVLSGTFSDSSCGDTDSASNAKVGCCKQNAGTSEEVEYCSYGGELVAAAAEEGCAQGDENGNVGTWVPAQ